VVRDPGIGVVRREDAFLEEAHRLLGDVDRHPGSRELSLHGKAMAVRVARGELVCQRDLDAAPR
jgi:hypothetical protein